MCIFAYFFRNQEDLCDENDDGEEGNKSDNILYSLDEEGFDGNFENYSEELKYASYRDPRYGKYYRLIKDLNNSNLKEVNLLHD